MTEPWGKVIVFHLAAFDENGLGTVPGKYVYACAVGHKLEVCDWPDELVHEITWSRKFAPLHRPRETAVDALPSIGVGFGAEPRFIENTKGLALLKGYEEQGFGCSDHLPKESRETPAGVNETGSCYDDFAFVAK